MAEPASGAAAGTVEALAQVVLEHHLDDLAARLAAAIQAALPEYEGIPREQLVASCHDNLLRSLQRFAQVLPDDRDLVDAPEHTAVQRARQGLPLDALLQSYRLGGRLLWDELLVRAQERGVDAGVMLAASTTVWDVIDAHSAAAARAYRAEEALLQRRDRVRQEVVLDALLDGAGRDPDFSERASALLQLPSDGSYVVVVASPADPGERPRTAEGLAELGYTSHWRIRNGRDIGLVALGGRSEGQLRCALRERGHAPAALSPVVCGLAELDRALQLAETALRTLGGAAEIVTFAERLPEVLLVAQPAVADILRSQLLGPVLALPAPERDALLATLHAVVVEGRTLEAAARELFCHRNTVMKRLDRITALTGRRLDSPREQLLLHLALVSRELDGRA